MARRLQGALPYQFDKLRAQIVAWRRAKARRTSPMPAALWTSAAALARSHGAYRVARALGLSHGTLHRRAKAKVTIGKTGDTVGTPPFVQLWPGSETHGDSPGDSVEVTNTTGAKLVVHMAASNRLDAIALVAAFVSQAA